MSLNNNVFIKYFIVISNIYLFLMSLNWQLVNFSMFQLILLACCGLFELKLIENIDVEKELIELIIKVLLCLLNNFISK